MSQPYKIYAAFLILYFLISGLLCAQTTGRINIAVMDVEAAGVDASAKMALSDRLRTELFNTGRFAVMERNKMNEILTEQGFQQSGGCISNECVVEAGKLLGVDRMIAGSIGKVGTIYTVALRMIDIETGRIMLSKTEDCNCPIEEVLTTSLKNVAFKMAGLSPEGARLLETQPTAVAGKGNFYFKSDPAEAEVFLDDQLLDSVTPFIKEDVPAGTHQIRMQKGYFSGSQTVFLEPNEFKRVELILSRAKGGLTIISAPLEADIFLDNKAMGSSPQTFTELDAGEHMLKLTKAGYLDYQKVVLISGGETLRLNIPLEKALPASLNITSNPMTCDVYVGGKFLSRTPTVVRDLMPGTILLKLSHAMYADWEKTLTLINGERKDIHAELNLRTGTIIIESDPTGAEVEVDGISKGQTPLTIKDIPVGKHALKIRKTNYQAAEKEVDLTSEAAVSIRVSLSLAKGSLSVEGSPNGAEVSLNDRIAGSLPLRQYQLAGGSYAMSVKAAGYEKRVIEFSIAPNEKINLNINLKMKSNSKAFVRSLFIPGLGQGYLEKKGKAVLFPIFEIGALAGVYFFNSKYSNAINEYNTTRSNYSTAVVQSEIDAYYHQMETKYDEIQTAEKMRKIFIGATVGIWLWNFADAALFGPATDNKTSITKTDEKKLTFYSEQSHDVGRIGMRYNF